MYDLLSIFRYRSDFSLIVSFIAIPNEYEAYKSLASIPDFHDAKLPYYFDKIQQREKYQSRVALFCKVLCLTSSLTAILANTAHLKNDCEPFLQGSIFNKFACRERRINLRNRSHSVYNFYKTRAIHFTTYHSSQ